jgi:tRNA threonylcarbamoyladenosine biosynthesis protein TsaB
MLLAIDTATRWLGLALYDGQTVSAEWGWRCHNRHTVELGPAVSAILQRTGTDIEDLSGVGVAIGPGSYTGLRVGLGLAKGLALARALPLVGVPTLDIVAAGIPELEGRLMVVAEAGRTRILAGAYAWERRQGWQADHRPVITTWSDLLDDLGEITIFAGEIKPDAAKQIRRAGALARRVPPPADTRRAGYLAYLAHERLRAGESDDPATLAPDYLREPAGS